MNGLGWQRSGLAFLFVLFLVPVGVLSGASSAPDAPAYWPTCPTPQPMAPMQAAGAASVSDPSDIAWNGREYGVVWLDLAVSSVYFRRFFADGTPAGAAALVSATTSLGAPRICWNGSSYGVAFAQVAPSGYPQIYFSRVTIMPAGSVAVGALLKVSHMTVLETTSAAQPVVASSPTGFAVVWSEIVGSSVDIRATLLDSSGNLVGSSDIVLCGNASDQMSPTVTWISGIAAYGIAWEDFRSGCQIWGNRLKPNGVVYSPSGFSLVAPPAGAASAPSLAGAGSAVGLAAIDTRDGNSEIYFSLFDDFLSPLVGDVRLTNNVAYSGSPRLIWTGAEWEVFFEDHRSGSQIWQIPLDASAGVVGSGVAVMTLGYLRHPAAAFGRYGFLATVEAGVSGANFVQPIACANDWTPPTCPTGLVAYGVTAAGATIAWVPSGEDSTDVAYYEVYRNGALVGTTSFDYWNDTGLSNGVTYNYLVRPVNAAQMVNTSCTGSIYVKASGALTLTVAPSEADARLDWTDARLNNYNVFRGTNPLVMTQVGSTAEWTLVDPNVLIDNVDYYYTVDEPGQ